MVGAVSSLDVAARGPSDGRGRLYVSGLWRGRPFLEEPSAAFPKRGTAVRSYKSQAPSAKCKVLSAKCGAVGRRASRYMASNIVGKGADHCFPPPGYKRPRMT